MNKFKELYSQLKTICEPEVLSENLDKSAALGINK